MKFNGQPFLFTIFLTFVISWAYAQNDFNGQQMFEAVDVILQENHIDYSNGLKNIDNRLPYLFLKEIDPDSKYLITPVVQSIYDIWYGFDPRNKNVDQLINETAVLFKEQLYTEMNYLLHHPECDFFLEDSVVISLMNSDTLDFDNYQGELEALWTKRLKYEVLISHKTDSVIAGLSRKEINLFLNERLKELIEAEKCVIESMLTEEALENYLLEGFLQAYCQSFDPHSQFLSNQNSERFISSLSSEVYSSGISFAKSGNKFVISDISSFSDAAGYEEISLGDEITGVSVRGEFSAPICLDMNVLNEIFYGDSKPTIELRLKSKKDNRVREFRLIKESNKNASNHTFSYLLNYDNHTVGYIQFPGFYSKYNVQSRSSSQDMALILLALKNKGIEDVIVDLRNNGGGSIYEASEIIKFFTNYGPLFSEVRTGMIDPELIKDTKKGQILSGKIVFLVNGFSASASEIVASAMQKYPNSLIVGSATYGKATGQTMKPVNVNRGGDSQGTVVVTNLKIYRFNGFSYQGDGVQPDVVIPTWYNRTLASESSLDFPLLCEKTRTYKSIFPRQVPLGELKNYSQARIENSEYDSLIRGFNHAMASDHRISLNFEEFKFPSVLGRRSQLTENQLSIEELEWNDAFSKDSQKIKEGLKKDPILMEAFNIHKDWVELTKSE